MKRRAGRRYVLGGCLLLFEMFCEERVECGQVVLAGLDVVSIVAALGFEVLFGFAGGVQETLAMGIGDDIVVAGVEDQHGCGGDSLGDGFDGGEGVVVEAAQEAGQQGDHLLSHVGSGGEGGVQDQRAGLMFCGEMGGDGSAERSAHDQNAFRPGLFGDREIVPSCPGIAIRALFVRASFAAPIAAVIENQRREA